MKRSILLLGVLFIVGCGSSLPKNQGRYELANDGAPLQLGSVDHIENAIPKYEPLSRGGNRDYTLRGKDYQIIKNPAGFTEQGLASWYGEKFHGYLTSNGEVYDMYSMSAAHKTLPLPSYVKITNTDNGKSIIVRVNDRGPFHDGRIIDLSYAAAYKLDVYQNGTAPVKIEYIDMSEQAQSQASATPFYIQVIALSDKNKAQTLATELAQQYGTQSQIKTSNDLYKIILGPIHQTHQLDSTLKNLQQTDYPSAFIQKN